MNKLWFFVKAGFVCLSLLINVSIIKVKAQDTRRQYLSGIDKDHTVDWDFYINTGRKSGLWSKIAVPSNWEQQGFGTYNYYKDTQNPDEAGQYKLKFRVQPGDSLKNIFLVFEASMTETEVKVNGKLAGPIHQGGFYRFKYDVTKLLNYKDDNLLEVTVKKRSANESVNQAERKADFWLFGGIFRPVYLEIVPQTYIDRIALDAKATGALTVDVYTANSTGAKTIKAQVQKLNGEAVGLPFSVKVYPGSEKTTLKQQVNNIVTWNPEAPALYNLLVSMTNSKGEVVHRLKQRFGFRTAELRLQDGFYVNGKKVMFKGVCRHSEWPESGRALSKAINIADIKLMKEMNMNAVRMSHYPPDQDFLDACDSLGMFVLDELTGWQAKYDTIVGRKLVKELVVRDVNHPSIVIWDNGNEGGFNFALDGDYAKYDPQNRLVIHPWERFNGTDTKHYPDYNYVQNSVLYSKEVFFPTEFMHGLFDGGHGAGLDDFWNLMMKHPHSAGGFLWSFHDEGVARTDRDGKIDVQGNAAPDGILGPHREKEGSFYTIKEIWSPVYVDNTYIPYHFDGKLKVENRYFFTNLNKCSFTWKLVSLPQPGSNAVTQINASGTVKAPDLQPGEKGFLQLNLPVVKEGSDVLYLTAYDAYHKELFTWSWPLKNPGRFTNKPAVLQAAKINAAEENGSLVITADNLKYYFDTTTGYLQKVVTNQTEIKLSNGPALAGGDFKMSKLNHFASGNSYIVEPVYEGKGLYKVQWTFTPGQLVKLDYQYNLRGEADYQGITFKFPEDQVTGMRWEGRGPYHVWKNRLKGQQFGVWHKDYNNTITGESYVYPEFKGYHADLYWVTVENREHPFTVYTGDKGIFFQMLKPAKPVGATNENTSPPFPDGDIGFLNSISAIGTKFQTADKLGPQSQKNIQLNYTPVSGVLWFDFNNK